MIPLKINNKQLCEIFQPTESFVGWTEENIKQYSLDNLMYPTRVELTSETYSRNAERTADYELGELTIVNRKAKPTFTWNLIPAEYVANLLSFINYDYQFKNNENVVIPKEAEDIQIAYRDFVGDRVINVYLGQTMDGTLVEYEGILYWQDFRIAFPER